MTVTPDPYNFVNGTTADAEQVDARFAPLYAALAGAIDVDNLTDAIPERLGLTDGATIRRGKFVQAAAGTRANSAYGALSNGPDEVANVVLPTDGLIVVRYRALWKGNDIGAINAAIFVSATQLKTVGPNTGVNPAQEASSTAGTADSPLVTSPVGLVSQNNNVAATFVTAGQVAGSSALGAGAVEIFAAAGTYTISVQFKKATGTVTVSNRTLLVHTIGFG